MKVDQACTPAFARHETFQPRWSWFRKAYEQAARDSGVFNGDDATLRLGVGKNMVKSIRFWGQAAKVIAAMPDAERPRQTNASPTPIGTAIFADEGWDPYCEDPGTLWLLHWLFLAPPSMLPVWWLAFNEFNAVEFKTIDVTTFCADAISAISSWDPPTENSIAKDVSVMARAYAATTEVGKRVSFDDLADSPLRELRLLRAMETPHRALRFVVGPKPSLPPHVAAYACVDFLARTDAGARTATVSRLASEPGAPGRAFRVSEDVLAELLDRASRSGLIKLTSPGGVTQLIINGEPREVGTGLLAEYYGRSSPYIVSGIAAGEPLSAQPSLIEAAPSKAQRRARSEKPRRAVGRSAGTAEVML